jgi:hypothetical protein
VSLTPKARNAGNSGTATNATVGVVIPAWMFAANDLALVWIVIAATGVTFTTVPTGFTALAGPTAWGGGATYVLFAKAPTSTDAAAQTTYNFVMASAARWAWVARVDDDATVEAVLATTGSGANIIPIGKPTGLIRADDREVAFYGTRPSSGAQDTLTAPAGWANGQSTSSTNATANNAAAGASDRQLFGTAAPDTANAGHGSTSFLRASLAVALKRVSAGLERISYKHPTAGVVKIHPAILAGSETVSGAAAAGLANAKPYRPAPPAITRWISSNGTGNGLTAGAPGSIDTFRTANSPGMVVGLYGPASGFGSGHYDITATKGFSGGGSSGNPVVFRAVDPNDPPVIRWVNTGTTGSGAYCFQLVTGVSWMDFYDLQFDGGAGNPSDPTTWASSGIRIGDNNAVANNHHIGVYGCLMTNLGAGGVTTGPCDYLFCIGNYLHHTGYNPAHAWASATSLWQSYFSDAVAGFHSVIVGNIIAGNYDAQQNTDGNGIIVDLRFNPAGDNPPALIANNVIYANGGDGIIATGSTDVWVVHNTIWKNGLDTLQAGPGITAVTSSAQGLPAARAHVFNNAVQTWPNLSREPFYFDAASQATGVLKANINAGVGSTFPAAWQDNVRAWKVPSLKLTSPPVIADSGGGLNATVSPLPWQLTHDLIPRADSPLIGQAMDVRAHADATSAYIAALNAYVARDILGNARDQAASPPIGAYAIAS